jgi:Ni,Fe-hydrogenase I small subunit
MASKNKRLLWLQSGGCGGCTLSLLNAESPSLFTTLADIGIELIWHPSFAEQSLDEAMHCCKHWPMAARRWTCCAWKDR